MSRLRIGMICALILAAGQSPARADAPPLIPVQGYLTDSEGSAIDGRHRVFFQIYDAESEGSPLHTDDFNNLEIDAGVFSVYLGSVNELDLAMFRDHSELWLEVVVDNEIISPRARIASVGYAGFAQMCGDATTLDGMAVTEFVSKNSAGTIEGNMTVAGDVNAGGAVTGAGTSQIWAANRTASLGLATAGLTLIPGMTVTFTLPRAATVELLATGDMRHAGDYTVDRCHVGMGFAVDSTLRGHPTWGQAIQVLFGSWWQTWSISRVENLPAGTHTIEVLADDSQNMCIICGEGDGAITDYTQCQLSVKAFYQ